jgi:MFS family permease
MTWGVAFFETDRHFAYGAAVLAASMVPLGWAFGCPLMGWAADQIRLRKPVLIAGTVMMAATIVQLSFLPDLLPATLTLFIFGASSGVAMIPYTIIKEANPDNVKGSATGAINFIVFGVTALVGPVFASLFAKTLTKGNPVTHFQHAASFWLASIILAGLISVLLRETGSGRTSWVRTTSLSSGGYHDEHRRAFHRVNSRQGWSQARLWRRWRFVERPHGCA